MLDREERQRLDRLAQQVRGTDPQFADALEHGHPRAPREYRRRRAWGIVIVAVAVLVPALFGHPLIGLVHGWVLCATSVLWDRFGMDRRPRGGAR